MMQTVVTRLACPLYMILLSVVRYRDMICLRDLPYALLHGTSEFREFLSPNSHVAYSVGF